MPERPRAEVEAQHYAGVLRQAIRAAGLSVSEVERRLGAGPRTLRRVFGGTTDLKIKHLVSVLRIIGMSQEEFFAIAARVARRRQHRPAGGQPAERYLRVIRSSSPN
jgi:AraC-like DNA-binding protein